MRTQSPPTFSTWLGTRVTDPSPALRADPFVKVYLLQDGRKISKKKTAVKRGDTNPVFNEAMIFSVPAIVLQVWESWDWGAHPIAPQAPQTHLWGAPGGVGVWSECVGTVWRGVDVWKWLLERGCVCGGLLGRIEMRGLG